MTIPVAQALERDSEVPLWRQLMSLLRKQIASGAFPDRLPTEQHLVSTYGVSRHTVREALRGLRADGLLVRQRGLGTFVANLPIEQSLNTFYSLARSAAEQGRSERSEVLRKTISQNARAAAALGLPASQPLVLLERLRYVDEEPLAIVRSWLPLEFGHDLTKGELTEGSLYDALRSRGVRVTDGWERIRADVPTARQRKLLGLPQQQAVLVVSRLAVAGEVPVEWRESTLRGDRYMFAARLLGDGGDRDAPLRYSI